MGLTARTELFFDEIADDCRVGTNSRIDNVYKELRTTSIAEMRNRTYALLLESIKSMNHEEMVSFTGNCVNYKD